MKNFNQIVAIGIIVLSSMTISTAQNQGPVLAEKLEMPEKLVKQTLQKRALIWIDGQWKIENNQYNWISAHWEAKKIGYASRSAFKILEIEKKFKLHVPILAFPPIIMSRGSTPGPCQCV